MVAVTIVPVVETAGGLPNQYKGHENVILIIYYSDEAAPYLMSCLSVLAMTSCWGKMGGGCYLAVSRSLWALVLGVPCTIGLYVVLFAYLWQS